MQGRQGLPTVNLMVDWQGKLLACFCVLNAIKPWFESTMRSARRSEKEGNIMSVKELVCLWTNDGREWFVRMQFSAWTYPVAEVVRELETAGYAVNANGAWGRHHAIITGKRR